MSPKTNKKNRTKKNDASAQNGLRVKTNVQAGGWLESLGNSVSNLTEKVAQKGANAFDSLL